MILRRLIRKPLLNTTQIGELDLFLYYPILIHHFIETKDQKMLQKSSSKLQKLQKSSVMATRERFMTNVSIYTC